MGGHLRGCRVGGAGRVATRVPGGPAGNRVGRFFNRAVDRTVESYGVSLGWVLRHQTMTLLVTLGTLVANLGYDKLVFPNPVFIGDTLRSETECVALRESNSRPNAGIVTWAHRSFNQRDELVCECTRTALIQKRPE